MGKLTMVFRVVGKEGTYIDFRKPEGKQNWESAVYSLALGRYIGFDYGITVGLVQSILRDARVLGHEVLHFIEVA